ncbi:MAG TPA: response regulator transcription factor [Acidimicrobiales bacterium]|nr:response regulator transcription factor [Acidimicrobiales bacterium]
MTLDGTRVVLVEDDESVRNAVEIALQGEGCDVVARTDGSAIAEILESFQPELFVLDVRLASGLDGVSITSELRRTSDVPVLLLTAADSVDDRLAGFRAGADDYIGKPFSMAELLARAEAVLRRSAGGAHRMGDLIVNDTTRTVSRRGREVNLTPTEYELLAALGRRPGRVLSKQDLLNQVWGFDSYADNLVEVHMSALRRKLEECGPRVIHTVRGIGYTLRV